MPRSKTPQPSQDDIRRCMEHLASIPANSTFGKQTDLLIVMRTKAKASCFVLLTDEDRNPYVHDVTYEVATVLGYRSERTGPTGSRRMVVPKSYFDEYGASDLHEYIAYNVDIAMNMAGITGPEPKFSPEFL